MSTVRRSARELRPVEIPAGDFLLRPFTPADEPGVAVAMTDPDILRWTAGSAVLGLPADQRARGWLQPRLEGWSMGHAMFAVTDTASGELLGSVTLRDVHRVPDQAVAAYWITPAARGRRLAARALDAASRWAFTPSEGGGAGLHRLSLDHALVNKGSCRVATTAGYQLEGTMRDYYVEVTGRRHDSHLHARLATDRVPRIAAPGTQAE
ncbi:GCN5-related N-acetyltransferase [Kribbella flavida DSM 17836]|uniref:GCN5-related N-acetyltransferase n=1 Tax=Kribbella flavida (strain DSM 17836 / JCM 10339 / NBRC 14399) TaxID=479435 RepID=D2PTK7_KRIFD|nr:GNAT family N-acetyltransferase [Kribbella flavida]ADB31320.1 GCN5-related N-acetyltransferase [Kribbella flavida DSM 17836]